MTNPLIHALALIAAIIIPGGLLVYFTWRVRSRCRDVKAAGKAEREKDPIEEIRQAFLSMYPKESLRARERRARLERARRARRLRPKAKIPPK